MTIRQLLSVLGFDCRTILKHVLKSCHLNRPNHTAVVAKNNKKNRDKCTISARNTAKLCLKQTAPTNENLLENYFYR